MSLNEQIKQHLWLARWVAAMYYKHLNHSQSGGGRSQGWDKEELESIAIETLWLAALKPNVTHFKALAKTMMIRRMGSYCRKIIRRRNILQPVLLKDVYYGEDPPRLEEHEFYEWAMSTIDGIEKDLLKRCFEQDLPVRVAGRTMGLTAGTTHRLYHAAIETIQKEFDSESTRDHQILSFVPKVRKKWAS